MVAKICRRISPRGFAYLAIGLTVVLCVYYYSDISQSLPPGQERAEDLSVARASANQVDYNSHNNNNNNSSSNNNNRKRYETCPIITAADADINTVDVYKDFEFQPAWMKSKEFWDKSFEDRFERQKMDPERPPLKVILVPHSHNDPGWLKTFEHYYHYQSRQILNHMVSKMQELKNLTFIWSEIIFLNAWWESAHPSKQRTLKSLVHSGRLEITTGGWVMTDEANAHVYAMVDQMIEGHQWLVTNLGIKPKSGWSIDPFGHGSTQPYILASSGIEGTIIQRIHYAWKQWFALKQYGDFRWVPNWTPTAPRSSLLTHNQPFDIYSIKHSCGPHPYICLNFDFRKVQGEYTDYSIKAQPINDKNVAEKTELLLEQFARTGSLFPHNVVLMPLGDDFRYNAIEEWDQQYNNYNKLIEHINNNKQTYKAEIKFGTPKDYFDAIMERFDQYPTLKGDFFVYSDIFTDGRPAYWSGYFTTRPFMKILDRELEHNLRAAEILYTVALNSARQKNVLPYIKILERDFEKLVQARRNLGLFQHHDAITGTSKAFVMRDYGLKLFEGIQDCVRTQQDALQSLIFIDRLHKPDQDLLLSDLERESYEKLPRKTPISIVSGNNNYRTRQIVLYNSLAQPQDYYVQIRVTDPDVKVTDEKGGEVVIQINPVWNKSEGFHKMNISKDEYELIFVAKLPALSLTTYNITHVSDDAREKLATIYCNRCHRLYSDDDKTPSEKSFLDSKFKLKNTQIGDIQLENHKFRLLFNGASGFLKTVTNKETQLKIPCEIQFAAYRSAQYHSGAYLFMPDPNERDIEKDVLQQYWEEMHVIITSGPVVSEMTVIYGQFLMHTVRIYHVENSTLSEAIYVENEVDFENPPKNRDTELFMRIITHVQNGDPPEFYSDLNGFQMQKRIKIDQIGVEGNYYPITSMAYIQDDSLRVSLLTNHAQGAASLQPGFLEVMLDRRTLYDDARGMGEGVIDNRRTVYKNWLLLEDLSHSSYKKDGQHLKRFENADDTAEKNEPLKAPVKVANFSRPSLFANHLSNSLNYPVNIYIIDSDSSELKINTSVLLLKTKVPCDLHLLTLRTQPDPVYPQFPSNSALMVFHRQGYECVNKNFRCSTDKFDDAGNFEFAKVVKIQPTTLTGTVTTQAPFTDLSDVYVEPMALQTFNVTFG